MKRFVFIFSIIITLSGCSKQTYFSISTNSSDIFYKGVENPFFITGYNADQVKVSVVGGNAKSILNKTDTFGLIITVDSFPQTIITIRINKKEHKYIYRNKRIPTPKILLSTASGIVETGKISLEKIRGAHFLLAQLWSFDYAVNVKVLNYKLTTYYKGERVTDYYDGSQITSGFLKIAASGDIFVFHDINIEFIDSKEKRTIHDATFIVE